MRSFPGQEVYVATINYCTLRYPEILDKHLKVIQDTPYFKVCRYTVSPGIIFRIPHGVEPGAVCHFFIEHEINFTNTLKTGTLTLKVQVTVVPVHMGLFSGFDELQGDYKTIWRDEECYGDETFVPDYENSDKLVVPLPIGGKTNLYEYLNEILFKHSDDLDIVHAYAVNLGCQKDKLKGVVFVPAPVNKSETNPTKSQKANKETELMFDFFSNQNLNLLPEKQ